MHEARKEKERREKEELEKWGEVFEIEASGEDAGLEESAVGRFVEYVKLRKVVHLEATRLALERDIIIYNICIYIYLYYIFFF